MNMPNDFYNSLIERFREVLEENNLLEESINITGKVLTSEEALGKPDRRDFPLLSGKEKLMQAEFKNSKGQAYTDMPGSFSGKLKDIISKTPENNFQRAVLISSINAVCCHLGLCDRTIHCKNNEPEDCAEQILSFIKSNYSDIKIALIGHQPSILEKLSANFEVRNLDLDNDKIGKVRFGVLVEHGIEKLDEVLNWCDIILATGSTIVNRTIVKYLDKKPVYFYGTTISGAAALLNLQRLCFCAA
ncbi:MAG: DUF364 domain-containing protein [Spirochaetales bacterium]|nr:DUF364 domain-containing protein [Spirochaetales bacterium]